MLPNRSILLPQNMNQYAYQVPGTIYYKPLGFARVSSNLVDTSVEVALLQAGTGVLRGNGARVVGRLMVHFLWYVQGIM